MELSKAALSEYNFQILIDGSGSMTDWHDSTITRWKKAEEIAKQVADFCAKIDDDGIDVILFGGNDIKAFQHVTSDKVYEIFSITQPAGSTPLAEAINEAIAIHRQGRKKSFIVVVTDGVPNDQQAVYEAIKNVSHSLLEKTDLTFLFLQVGDDQQATRFLTGLDDHLTGAKFDIVNVKQAHEYAQLSFEKLFYIAQQG